MALTVLDESAGEPVRHWYASLMVKVLASLLAVITITIVGATGYWFATAADTALSLAFWLVRIGTANAALLLVVRLLSRYRGVADAQISWRLVAAALISFAVVAGAFRYGLWYLAARS